MPDIVAANRVLAVFAPDSKIEYKRKFYSVRFVYRNAEISKPWRTHNNDFYPTWSRLWSHGGTATIALSQLIRWLQNKTVLPISTWKYWASDKVSLIHNDAISWLRNAGYPETVECVLCKIPLSGPLDWWRLDGISGPCCSMYNLNGCKQKAANLQSKLVAPESPQSDPISKTTGS